jgi:hypothetical protein
VAWRPVGRRILALFAKAKSLSHRRVFFDDFSRYSSSHFNLCVFDRHRHHRVTATKTPATPFRERVSSRNLLNTKRPQGRRAR